MVSDYHKGRAEQMKHTKAGRLCKKMQETRPNLCMMARAKNPKNDVSSTRAVPAEDDSCPTKSQCCQNGWNPKEPEDPRDPRGNERCRSPRTSKSGSGLGNLCCRIDFQLLGVPCWGVLVERIIAYWGLSHQFGNCHLGGIKVYKGASLGYIK